ncbi:hypothetical protein [Streptomyces sp. NPDC059850]|uniref:hypothetical protein n=1 Tax=Streptomyces sp. NPDC059850 TaxID=3346970 RepID=UPI0036599894
MAAADRPGAALADADWAAYLLTIDARPAGLALVRARHPVPRRPELAPDARISFDDR